MGERVWINTMKNRQKNKVFIMDKNYDSCNRKKRLNKVFVLFGLTLSAITPLIPINVSIQRNNSNKSGNRSFQDGNNEPTIAVSVSQKQYDDYVISVRDNIAAKMNSIVDIANKHEA
jgi:hypothetical protein